MRSAYAEVPAGGALVVEIGRDAPVAPGLRRGQVREVKVLAERVERVVARVVARVRAVRQDHTPAVRR